MDPQVIVDVHPLLEKYGGAGPRYTSYPPANRFDVDVDHRLYAQTLGTQAPLKRVGVYVHVPFCEHRCAYCGCHVVPTRNRSVADDYLHHLELETELIAGRLRSTRSLEFVHFGGGTPTFLSPGQLTRLVSAISSSFSLDSAQEIAIELDPRVTTGEHIDALVAVGVNRVSLGVQDFSDEVQSAIGRGQTREQTDGCFRRCRDACIESINIDLVYGLPCQTADRFAETLDSVVDLDPDRVSVFGYAHLPRLRSNQREIDERTLPSPTDRLELLLQAHARLQEAGYVHVGLDHFARPKDVLARAQKIRALGRGFMGYTPFRGATLIGLGVSSISEVAGNYFQNEKKLSRYFERVCRSELPIERGWVTSETDRARRFVIHELLCNLRVDYADFEMRVGTDFSTHFETEIERLAAFRDDGLVELRAGELEVTPTGRLFLRSIGMVFDEYLAQDDGESPVYSRIV